MSQPNQKELLRILNESLKDVSGSPKKSEKLLRAAGIIDKTGNLAKPYRRAKKANAKLK